MAETEELNEEEEMLEEDEEEVEEKKRLIKKNGEDNEESLDRPITMSNVTVDPPAAAYTQEGGTSTHQINNPGPDKVAIKVKCSDNNLFKVSVVYAFVEAGAPIPLEIQRSPGPPKEDRLVVQHQPAGAAADPKECFPPGGTFPEVTVTLSCA